MALNIEYCDVCGLPPEYCEYGPCFDLCKPWLKETHLDLYPELSSIEFTQEQIEATQEAIAKRAKISQPLRKKSKKDTGVKELIFTIKSRQKHKYITIVTGLDLWDVKIKEACKTFGKKFSCGVSTEKSADGKDEVHVQGDIRDELADLINELYDIPLENMFFVEKNKKTCMA
ncbi:hypothetical protein WA158_003446 [Blastocystis sp. Blastoise]